MKAEWLDGDDIHTCLCCGQFVAERGGVITPERAERSLMMFEALGLTRADLLGKHRKQIYYQAPGFAEWLEGH